MTISTGFRSNSERSARRDARWRSKLADRATLDAGAAAARTLLETAVRSAVGHRSRMSANRQRVLKCILGSDGPMTAYSILRRLRTENPKAAPLSVYRALGFLMRSGLIDRIELLNAYVSRSDPSAKGARQFLVCGACRRVEEIGEPAITETLREEAESRGFQVERLVVEFGGICKTCGAARQVNRERQAR
jgi:Fur family transcriptional regulator, zinc uptake regulator